MRYLDKLAKNTLNVKGTFVPQRELFIAGGTKMGTISVGYGLIDGEKIQIAKKIPINERTDLRKKFLKDLWFIDRLARYDLDNFEYQFPLVYGLEVDPEGTPISIITEDYSKRNSVLLYPAQWHELHPCVANVVQDPNLNLEEMSRVGFKVGDERIVRLGDFDTFANPNTKDYKSFLKKLSFNLKKVK